eukprot:976281-Pyramimonas_sp.AAC.1
MERLWISQNNGRKSLWTKSAAGIYESAHITLNLHACVQEVPVGRPKTKWTASINHPAVHAEMRTCVVAPTRTTG